MSKIGLYVQVTAAPGIREICKRIKPAAMQLGHRLLAFCLRERLTIPEGLLVPAALPMSLHLSNQCSVRW